MLPLAVSASRGGEHEGRIKEAKKRKVDVESLARGDTLDLERFYKHTPARLCVVCQVIAGIRGGGLGGPSRLPWNLPPTASPCFKKWLCFSLSLLLDRAILLCLARAEMPLAGHVLVTRVVLFWFLILIKYYYCCCFIIDNISSSSCSSSSSGGGGGGGCGDS